MKRSVSLIVIISFSMMVCVGCVSDPNQRGGYDGNTALGGILGALAGGVLGGAIAKKGHKGQGIAIGALAGALFGGAIVEISKNAARKAANTGYPQKYQDNNGNYGEARVVGLNPITRCKKVQRNTYNNGQLVDSSIDEICESEKITNTY